MHITSVRSVARVSIIRQGVLATHNHCIQLQGMTNIAVLV